MESAMPACGAPSVEPVWLIGADITGFLRFAPEFQGPENHLSAAMGVVPDGVGPSTADLVKFVLG
jgi:hypothetical protein